MISSFLLAASLAITVKTGIAPGPNPLVTMAVPELKGTLEVVDAKGRTVPCAVRMDPSGVRFVAFRLERPGILELMDFTVREVSGKQGDLADIPTVLPGMNLVANADFARRDENGDIADWAPSSGYGQKDRWTRESRAAVSACGGEMTLSNVVVVAWLRRGIVPGHVYRVSFDGYRESKRMGVTLWFQGDCGKLPNDYIDGVGNYKNSSSVDSSGRWQHVESSTFVYFDKASERTVLGCRRLLPGTGSAYLQVKAADGVCRIKNLRVEDITEDAGVRAVRKRTYITNTSQTNGKEKHK